MNISQMKNIVVLRDIPSNIVDEAIVILKNNTNIKVREFLDNKSVANSKENVNGNYDFVVNEAENVIKDYIKKIENPKEMRSNTNKILIKYRKLQVSSFLLGIIAIIGIIINIIN